MVFAEKNTLQFKQAIHQGDNNVLIHENKAREKELNLLLSTLIDNCHAVHLRKVLSRSP